MRLLVNFNDVLLQPFRIWGPCFCLEGRLIDVEGTEARFGEVAVQNHLCELAGLWRGEGGKRTSYHGGENFMDEAISFGLAHH